MEKGGGERERYVKQWVRRRRDHLSLSQKDLSRRRTLPSGARAGLYPTAWHLSCKVDPYTFCLLSVGPRAAHVRSLTSTKRKILTTRRPPSGACRYLAPSHAPYALAGSEIPACPARETLASLAHFNTSSRDSISTQVERASPHARPTRTQNTHAGRRHPLTHQTQPFLPAWQSEKVEATGTGGRGGGAYAAGATGLRGGLRTPKVDTMPLFIATHMICFV
jgi:hypothetical protein